MKNREVKNKKKKKRGGTLDLDHKAQRLARETMTKSHGTVQGRGPQIPHRLYILPYLVARDAA